MRIDNVGLSKEEVSAKGFDFRAAIKGDIEAISELYGNNFSDEDIAKKAKAPISLVNVVIGGLNRALRISPEKRIWFLSGNGG